MTVFLSALLIFTLRVCDVSIGTLRSLYAHRGFRTVAAMLGLVESLIFVFAISTVFAGEKNLWMMLGYAAGFATGNFGGVTIERGRASGTGMERIIVRGTRVLMMEGLRAAGFGTTAVEGTGGEGEVHIFFIVAPRKRQPELLELVEKIDPHAFVTLDAVNHAQGGYLSFTPPASSVRK